MTNHNTSLIGVCTICLRHTTNIIQKALWVNLYCSEHERVENANFRTKLRTASEPHTHHYSGFIQLLYFGMWLNYLIMFSVSGSSEIQIMKLQRNDTHAVRN